MILHGAIPSFTYLLLSMEKPALDPFLCAHEDSRAPSTEDSIPASPQSGSGSGSTCVELPPDEEGGTSETNGPPESPPVEIQGGGDKRATREDPADSPTDSPPDSWKKRYQVVVKVLVKYGTIHEIWFTIHGEDSAKCHHEVLADSPTPPSWNKRCQKTFQCLIRVFDQAPPSSGNSIITVGDVVEESRTSGRQRMAGKVHWNQLYGNYLTETARGWRCQGYQVLPIDIKKSSLGSYVVLQFWRAFFTVCSAE